MGKVKFLSPGPRPIGLIVNLCGLILKEKRNIISQRLEDRFKTYLVIHFSRRGVNAAVRIKNDVQHSTIDAEFSFHICHRNLGCSADAFCNWRVNRKATIQFVVWAPGRALITVVLSVHANGADSGPRKERRKRQRITAPAPLDGERSSS